MNVQLRPATPADAEECGRIIYEAFSGIADRHNFRRDFESPEFATEFVRALITNPTVFGVAAEQEGRVVGSNFLWEHDPIRAVGPITVDPHTQARGVGRLLMRAVIERGRGAAGVRLVQDSFNLASLSLYTSLGFDVKEPLVEIEGRPTAGTPDAYEVRPLRDEDLGACEELCKRVHGFERTNELKATPPMLTPVVALRGGRVAAYASGPTFWAMNHAVAETEEDMQALLAGAAGSSEAPLSFILPTRQAGLFRWCLGSGLRVVKPMNLMSTGAYQEPRGCYLPSVGY